MQKITAYFKKNWAWGLGFAIPLVIFQKGYVYPELRFEWDFLQESTTYISMLFYWFFWTITQFFIWEVLTQAFLGNDQKQA
ncbi:hypothetical protein [Algoriphagus sp.]|uniref:hypothetical protein n=1 Tax=Algoriphagus sp. TaxID=1872435 RepID=UPI002617B296|nr:hypothetical protein [Algoriphagus sp.]